MIRFFALRTLVALLFLATFFTVATEGAFAGTGLTIQPVKVSHTLNPGDEVSGVISLKNASDDDQVKVETKVEDFIPLAGASTVQFVGRAPGVTTVRDWITIDTPADFVFKKGDAISIPYTVRAPLNAEPGGHYGVLFFKASRLDANGGQLQVGTQVGILVLVTIPGNHLQKGKILDFKAPEFTQSAPVPFTIKFENTGTVHFEPKGKIIIKNIFGRKVAEVPVEGQVVLPTGIRDLTAEWDTTALLLGRYTAELSLLDGEGSVITAESVKFYVVPVWYIVEFIAGLILAYLALRYVRRKVKINISIN